MRAILACFLGCLSVFAADTTEIRLFRRTDAKVSPGNLVAYETFTRNGQTNLLRITSTRGGVTNSVAHNFYHKGAFLGCFSQSSGFSFFNSAANAPYRLGFAFDSSNQVMVASVTTTNYVALDSFACTNGVFHPVAGSAIEESNRRIKDVLPR